MHRDPSVPLAFRSHGAARSRVHVRAHAPQCGPEETQMRESWAAFHSITSTDTSLPKRGLVTPTTTEAGRTSRCWPGRKAQAAPSSGEHRCLRAHTSLLPQTLQFHRSSNSPGGLGRPCGLWKQPSESPYGECRASQPGVQRSRTVLRGRHGLGSRLVQSPCLSRGSGASSEARRGWFSGKSLSLPGP